MRLRDLRLLLGKTQVEVAEAIQSVQSLVSVAEQPHDHRVSTLRRYVQGLGGELDLVARFDDTQVKLCVDLDDRGFGGDDHGVPAAAGRRGMAKLKTTSRRGRPRRRPPAARG